MTTIYVQHPGENRIREVKTSTNKPKVALQKYIANSSYADSLKKFKATDSGYTYTMSNGHKVMAY